MARDRSTWFLAGVISHIEHLWEDPALARLFDRQGEFSRLILVDRRLRWQDRGMQVLKGVPGHWPLFALEREPA